MKTSLRIPLLIAAMLVLALQIYGQRNRRSSTPITTNRTAIADSLFKHIKLRNIGPAFMSGRIADIAISPEDDNTWYVAVGSGGVWKTVNAGTTWTPIFDKQASYSIGCVAVDPNNPHVIWVGTGENVGGRHVGFGDGIYRSDDGGASWKNMGLETSEHISKIVVHPDNSDVIMVASQGPLWASGGERGFYKSTDGGQSWNKTLGDDQWVGVTDIVVDPRDANRVYAATWQRHRTVAAYMGGGPGTALFRSTDAGDTWEKLSRGLPKGAMGKIGLAISPQKPDVIYAAIELQRRTGGVYRSTDRGSTWTKMSNTVSGATGPHYYQELYASPHKFDHLYLVDNQLQQSLDGGKTFTRVNNQHKHGDNHALAFRDDDPDYLLIGTDGGVYESFDLAKNWRFIENLPLTQFYKIALDDTKPFYNIYGGTQDNGTQGGPSRTDNVHGIRNADWKLVLNWDGHQPATEPGNPNIMYAERQQGALSRLDLSTGEAMDIQPQPGANENFERYNWDAPILVSPHSPSTIFFASQRVWKSENRGDSWTAISGDLTKNENRIELPIMGRKQSWDAAWDVLAMSNYNTITSLSESPIEAGVLYAGTDDGIVQITEDGGGSWRRVDVGTIPGVPSTAFINDIKADLHDGNTVYVSLDNHKYGDFKPYLVKSADRGRTWQSIAGDLPGRNLVWRLVQDHVKPELMFLATEFGIYFTINSGKNWIKTNTGSPISFRDLAIHKGENDLVGASFGRGIFILDDYSFLRDLTEQSVVEEALLFTSRKAPWYIPRPVLSYDDSRGSSGASHFVAPNPPFGAVFTYFLKESLNTKEEARKAAEKSLNTQNRDVPFPGYDAVEDERTEIGPNIWLVIKDNNGQVVRRVKGTNKQGFQRVAWDLRYPATEAIQLRSTPGPFGEPRGFLAAPGNYSATLFKEIDGNSTQLAGPVSFEVERLYPGTLQGSSPEIAAKFWRDYENMRRSATALQSELGSTVQRADAMIKAIAKSTTDPGNLDAQLHKLRKDLLALSLDLSGNGAMQQVGEKGKPTIGDRDFNIFIGLAWSTYGPTDSHRKSLEIINNEMNDIQSRLQSLQSEMAQLGRALIAAGAPWVEGQKLPSGH